jgi:hypothetical protein
MLQYSSRAAGQKFPVSSSAAPPPTTQAVDIQADVAPAQFRASARLAATPLRSAKASAREGRYGVGAVCCDIV